MQGNDSYRLVVRRGPQPNQIYELNKDIVTVGRDITNDIVINDPEASRHHMRLTRGAGSYTLEDLGSTNGTFVNGQRLTGAKPLSNGDMIGLGETVTLSFEISRSTAAGVGPGASPTMPGAAAQVPAPQPLVSPSYSVPAPQPSYSPTPSYEAPQPAYSAPQPPRISDYDYDPYAAREEEPRSTMRWIVIGCVGIMLFCCCITIAGLVVVDQACLWDDIPILADVLDVVGFSENVSSCT